MPTLPDAVDYRLKIMDTKPEVEITFKHQKMVPRFQMVMPDYLLMTLSLLSDVGRLPNLEMRPEKPEVEMNIERNELAA